MQGEEDVNQGGAPRPASRGRAGQHLRQRGAARRGVVAAAASVDACNFFRPAAAGRAPVDRGHQAGASAGRGARVEPGLSLGAVSRVRPSRSAVPAPALHRYDPAPHAGGPIDVLLSGLPEIARRPPERGVPDGRAPY